MIKRVDENGNVRLITNIRKPRKWRRYEYLQSSGTQYIDTGIKLTEPLTIEIEFVVTNVTNIGMILGAFYDNSTQPKYQFYTSSSKFSLSYLSSNNIVTNDECTANQKYNTIINTTRVSTENLNVTLYLFARNNDIGNIIKHKGLRIYSVKFYQNNTLIRDFAPAQYNGQYGMWDLVENKFYPNKGTGSFTVGPEIKNYDEIYEVRKTSSILPAGVELYDSLKFSSSSNTYIETGLTPTSTTEYKLSFKPYSTTWAIFGASTTTANGIRLFYNGHLYAGFGTNRSENTTTITANATHIVTYKKTQLTIDSTNYSVGQGTSFPTTLSIGRDQAWENGVHGLNGEVHYFQIYDNNILIRNFLPCTYLGEPGMWDTVENKFYRNQGTGQFTLGSKITLKEYEYLESSNTQYIDTNFYPNQNSGSELKVQILPSSTAFSKLLYTDYTNINEDAILWGWDLESASKFRPAYYKNQIIIANGTFNNDDIYLLKINKNIYSINGITVLTNSTINFQSPSTAKLFAKKNLNGSVSSYIAMRLYYCKLYNDNQLVRDFTPISYNGTPGLWDKVEWKFYANAGSGNFTLGPEKKSGVFPISFGTLEYSEGSNISSSLLTVTGSGKTSTPPRAAINACTQGYKVEFSNVSVAKTYVIELDFTWTGNWGFTSDGNPRLFFQGTTKTSGGSYEWKGTNYITASLNNRKSLLGLVQSNPSGGRYHYIGVFTIPANDRVGYSIETRCDYSDGNGSFTYGNLKIYSYN